MKRAVLIVLLINGVACSNKPAEAPKTAPAAKVEGSKPEAELATIKLTEESEKHLALQTAALAYDTVTVTRTVGGEAIVPPGRGVTVNAPVAGTLSAGAQVFVAGSAVDKNQVIVELVPLQAAERDVTAELERGAREAEARLTESTSRLRRLEQLLKDGAASQRSVEEARSAQAIAVAAADASRQKLSTAGRVPMGGRGELAVRAPFAGVITALHAAPGQTVAAGAPIAEVAQVGALWLRVPVYAGDMPNIDSRKPASFSRLGQETTGPWRAAQPVSAPPTANASAASVDLFFAADGVGALRPGERVSVRLPLRETERALVAPQSAVVYDTNGGTWIYEVKAAHTYARRRVEIGAATGSTVAVRRGLAEGVRIVTVGAAELYSTEFYVAK